MNNIERWMWVLNSEGLWQHWKQTGYSKRRFIRECRTEIDEYIDHALNKRAEQREAMLPGELT